MPNLDEQIETVEANLVAMIRIAETGAQWADICLVEDRDLVPLLKRRLAPLPAPPVRPFRRLRFVTLYDMDGHERAAAGFLDPAKVWPWVVETVGGDVGRDGDTVLVDGEPVYKIIFD